MILECFEYNQHFVAMMNIINHARLCNVEGKFEKHHIIPRCFYKNKGLEVDNSSSNLVNLTIEEHKKKIYEANKLYWGKRRKMKEENLCSTSML